MNYKKPLMQKLVLLFVLFFLAGCGSPPAKLTATATTILAQTEQEIVSFLASCPSPTAVIRLWCTWG